MALSLSSQQREALKHKGRDLYARKLYRDALECFNRAAQGTPSLSVLDHRAATFEKLGDLDAALNDAMAMIKQQRDSDRAYLRCGNVLQKMGKHQKALAVYKKGIERCCTTAPHMGALTDARDKLQSAMNQTTAVDFVGRLPLEILEMVFAMLPFHAMCKCMRVSKAWNRHLTDSRRLWTDVDFSAARRTVPTKTLSAYIQRSQNKVRRLSLHKVPVQGNRMLARLMSSCADLAELRLTTGGALDESLTNAVRLAAGLRTLFLGESVVITMTALNRMLHSRPTLASIDCHRVDMDQSSQMPWPQSARLQNLEFLGVTINEMQDSRVRSLDYWLPEATRLKTLRFSTLMKHIEIDVSDSGGAENVGLALRFPELETLTLRNVGIRHASHRSLKILDLNSSWPWLDPSQQEAAWPSGCSPVLREASLDRANSTHGTPVPAVFKWVLHTFDAEKPHLLNAFNISVLPESAGGAWRQDMIARVIEHPSLRDARELGLFHGRDIITDTEAEMITDFIKGLERLKLPGSSVTGVGVKKLVLSLPKLGYLNLTSCQNVSSDAIEWARSQGVQVVTMHMG